MKNFGLFLIITLVYFISIFIDVNFINTDAKIFDFLAKDYPNSVVQNYMESQKKWWWVSYAITPVLIGIKVLLVAFCLNFVKIISDKAEKIKFSDLLFVVLIAEFVFIIAGLYFLMDDVTKGNLHLINGMKLEPKHLSLFQELFPVVWERTEVQNTILNFKK